MTVRTVVATVLGENLANINFKHPFYDQANGTEGEFSYKRLSPIFLAVIPMMVLVPQTSPTPMAGSLVS